MKHLKLLISIILCFLPWSIRRLCLEKFFGYKIDKSARIGFSVVLPDYLEMGSGAVIGNFNVIINLWTVKMERLSSIRRGNWITGYPKYGKHFQSSVGRESSLVLGIDSGITKNHLIDCTDLVSIGDYTSIGGYGTQILSHSTSIEFNEQRCKPILIGRQCFVGTRSIILPGSVLPDKSVLGAGAVLQKKFEEPGCLYAGVPAEKKKNLDPGLKFINRISRPR